MDSNNCSNDSEFVREFLQQLEEKYDTAMIPAAVLLTIFSVVGLAGNILVLVVYSKKVQLSPTKVLIMSIASFDLVANVAGIPTEIMIMFSAWNLRQRGMCTGTAFLASFTAVGAALCLVTVAVIRYRKVCRPYGWQVTIKQAVVASVTNVLLALIFSIPYIVIYGVGTRPTSCPNIKGHDCFYDDRYLSTDWPLFNNILFFLLYIFLSFSMVVLYTLIGVMAWKHSKLHGISAETSKIAVSYNSTSQLSSSVTVPPVSLTDTSTEQTNSTQGDTSNLSIHGCLNPLLSGVELHTCETTEDTSATAKKPNSTITEKGEDKTSRVANPKSTIVTTKEVQSLLLPPLGKPIHDRSETEPERDSSSVNDFSNEGNSQTSSHLQINTLTKGFNPKRLSGVRQVGTSPLDPAKMEKTRLPVRRMTAMLIIISAIFVLGFLPYLSLTIYLEDYPEMHASLNQLELAFFNIAYRLYFFQSATNPIVYGFCDTNFRRNCIQLMTCKRFRIR